MDFKLLPSLYYETLQISLQFYPKHQKYPDMNSLKSKVCLYAQSVYLNTTIGEAFEASNCSNTFNIERVRMHGVDYKYAHELNEGFTNDDFSIQTYRLSPI